MNDMVDMSRFVEAKSDQLNSDDLLGGPRTITVRKVTGNEGEQPVSIYYEGDDNKPWKPCKTMRRVLMGVWGAKAPDYVGRSLRLYRDDKVQFGGLQVGGIRVSHMSHIDTAVVVGVNAMKGRKTGIKVEPLKMPAQQQSTGYTLEEAERDLAAAKTLDALRAVWMRKPMAPFREQLQPTLDRYKAALADDPQYGRADEDHGDQHDGTANQGDE